MHLFPDIEKAYTKDRLSARAAQRLAEFIAFGPIVFQASRLMVKSGILERLREQDMTLPEIAQAAGLSEYAAKVLLEASLSIGTVLIDTETDKYSLSKTGWFLLNDPAARVNMDFNHDVNYEGFFHLEEALAEGRPAGLKHFGDWPTLYEGLSSLPDPVKKSWFAFDHFYSDHSFDEALQIVFAYHPKRLMDVGGNTGRWALRCVEYDPDVRVTIVDLPQQLGMMREQTAGKPGAERIDGYAMDMLDPGSQFPADLHPDVIWMSQFLDCFSEAEIRSILRRAAKVMGPESRLAIMETFWDRQKYEPASFCLTMTSLYFTVMANGNSKMYHSDDMTRLVEQAGMTVEKVHDGLGQGHSILICKIK
jgi:ubiquinone/menaquinone biosynthesis C-methylase UbiE